MKISDLADYLPTWAPRFLAHACCYLVVATVCIRGAYSAGLDIGQSRGELAARRYVAAQAALAEQRGWLTSAEVAEREGISQRTVTRWATAGEIEGAEKVGGVWRFATDYRITVPNG